MVIGGHASQAISTGRESLESVADWFAANWDELPIALGSAAAIILVMLGLRWTGGWLLASDPESRHWRGVIGRVLQKTTIIFMVATALDIVGTYAAVPQRIERPLDILFIVTFALQGAIWARELVLGVITRNAGENPSETAVGNALAVIRVLVSVALFAIALIVILDNLGVNVTALVAGLGIGGIAIGLAAQGIFSDLFAALSILFDKPFKKGDTIRYDQSTGTVERIGLKTTRLRSVTGEQLIMANTKLLEREIHNLAQAKARRFTLYIAIAGDASAASIKAVGEAAAAAVADRKGCKLVRCALAGAGGGALTYDLVYDDTTRDNEMMAANRSAILSALIERIGKNKLHLMRASDQPTAPLPF